MLWNTLQEQTVELGWSFYGPVLIFVLLCTLGVPVWAAIGSCAIGMLYFSGVLPMSLMGESLFSGIDAFALTAVPLFILTGDALVRTGLSRKFLDVAEALTCWARGGFGSATVLVCGMFSAISGSDGAGKADPPAPTPVPWWLRVPVRAFLFRRRLPISSSVSCWAYLLRPCFRLH